MNTLRNYQELQAELAGLKSLLQSNPPHKLATPMLRNRIAALQESISALDAMAPVIPSSTPDERCAPVCTIRPGTLGSAERVLVRSRRYSAAVSDTSRRTSHLSPTSRLVNRSGASVSLVASSEEN